MVQITDTRAIAIAQAQLGTSSALPARALRVARKDQPGEAYWLVVLGHPQASLGVAAINARTGEAMSWASLPGTTGHLGVEEAAAIHRTHFSPATATLVWKPCSVSRSPLYPLWEVSDGQRTVYVDQKGLVWESLEDRKSVV